MMGTAGAGHRAHTDALIEMVSSQLDLVAAPFTLPRSRILVQRHPDSPAEGGRELRVSRAEYERSLSDCIAIERLSVCDKDGEPLDITRVLPHRIEFGGGQVTLTFAGADALSIGVRKPGPADGRASAEVHLELRDRTRRSIPLLPGASVVLQAASDGSVTISPILEAGEFQHDDHLRSTARVWAEWFDRCPRVREDLQPMTALCWWVLGANIVELPGLDGARAVVPSKIGYVGLWQWDAYFIAIGLRHGDPELAREQLDIAFRFPTATGQLPDVVHDEGVLASSDDLPPHDLEVLRAHGSSIADPAAPVPLTKPPLAGWALRKVLESTPAQDRTAVASWANAAWDTIARSQDWWFVHSDLDGDGMPEYGHPYSSGLDDSPIFDGPFPLASPDLGAYLVLQDRELARHFTEQGNAERAEACGRRADATLAGLLAMWDAATGRFLPHAGERIVRSYTAVSLLPLLTGELPAVRAELLVAALSDPAQFGTTWGVPTVAANDPDFSDERMWRGPVWVNINALLVEGLRSSGYPAEATRLAEQTVALVIHGRGPSEYFNPSTGHKAHTATTSFGWSAALFIDLAVTLSP
ncbi:hypothetical protein QMG83_00090 [Salinibacterium sp. G-O1]|uniref:amylo-alpha-1,6-glucosidase n=1 Tax=Salinibacterium sp. G-O1 TaxID=3046208 RepID=UPI0024B9E2B1|nr:hypothetical protein [Salinibacterium sp. G-O1]MDJ0333615.1 hypothetical protein [Salinibacterium sp. G-O1]